MVIVTYPASGTLADLNQLVKEQEAALDGPLADIGNKDGWTTIDIDDLEPNGKPALPSLITTASPPAGAKVIAKGKVYISGALTDATAYRPVGG